MTTQPDFEARVQERLAEMRTITAENGMTVRRMARLRNSVAAYDARPRTGRVAQFLHDYDIEAQRRHLAELDAAGFVPAEEE